MRVLDLLTALDDIVPLSGAEEWDPVGLQIGGDDRQVGTVAVCHEVTEAVTASAVSLGVDTLVAYHPLLFIPTTSLTDGPTPAGRALRLAAAGVSLIVVHTAFDAARPGTGDALAETLCLDVAHVFGGAVEGSGIGRIALVDQTLDAAALGGIIDGALDVESRVADGGGPIERVALVPGSGASFIEQASELADALVTGDVSHHRARFAADIGLTIVDAGHAATERPGIEALYSVVSAIADDAVLLDDDPTPWKD